jgi:hypothetical protein
MADPVFNAKRIANSRSAQTDEVKAKISASRKATEVRLMKDPAYVEMKRQQGLKNGKPNLVRSRLPETNAKRAMSCRRMRLAWCPEEYWQMNADLKRAGFLLDERKVMIAEEITRNGPEAEARRQIADFTARQIARVERERQQAY